MSAQKTGINLLPKDKFASSLLGRVVTWLLSTFRVIVVIIEMFVMAAFLSRFWLDAKISDLNEEIEQKKALISASRQFEKDFRQTQSRLQALATLTKDDKPFTNFIASIPPHLPAEIYLKNISLIPGAATVTGIAPSEISLAQLIVNLRSVTGVDKIILAQLDTDREDENLLSFTLNISFKKNR